ncbi:MAG: amino acid transporter [Saprospiraceae bacterium]|nr:MAG: amino acid transporter [Saprospiraceae bacterium]
MKKLERSLTLSSVIAISVGGMLGSGIFVLPGLAAAKTGPSVWMAYLLAGLCVLPAALSKSELATAMPTSGGTYIYIERAFGPIIGTIAGLGLWLSLLLKSSFALVGFGAYLMVMVSLPLKPVALSFLALIAILNIMGVKKVGQVQIVVVTMSLSGLIVLLLMGLPEVNPANLDPLFINGNSGLLAATAFVFVSYAGVTKVAAIAEEIKNPDRNLPIAMMSALMIVTLIYALVSFTMVGNIPIAELQKDIHPVYTLAEKLGGSYLGIGAAILGVITLISMANSGVLAASRFPFAMSRDKLVPTALGKVHSRFLTPLTAILVTCILMAFVILFLDVEKIAKLASAFKVMMFVIVNGCVIVLRETSVQWYRPSYRSPFYPWIQIFGILSGIVLLIVLGVSALLAAFVIILAGLFIYYVYGRVRVSRSGVLKLYGHRPASYLLYQRNRRKNKPRVPVSENYAEPLRSKANLDSALASTAGVVIPLFGKERSPETLVEMGSALAYGAKVQVVHLNEVPDQTVLDALLEDSPTVTSLNRRISAMAEERKVDVDFDAAVTHELVETIHRISTQTHCRWMVLGWDGRAGYGLFVRNPVGWLVTHLDSNFALFKDNGVRYIRRILVALRPGKNDAQFMIACDRIARFYQAEFSLIRVWVKDLDEENQIILERDTQALIDQCESEVKVIYQQHKDPVKMITKTSEAYDLLIIGTTKEATWLDVLLGTKKDRFAEHAACSVLRLTIH